MSNVMMPTRPYGDATNAGASTEFVSLATGQTPATFIEAVAAATTNILVPNPHLSLAGDFILDGQIINDQEEVFFPAQNNLVQNGLWIYTLATNTLTRPPDYASGAIIHQPFYVSIDSGDLLGGQRFRLESPTIVLIDTTPSVWVNSATGTGLLLANQGTLGDTNPIHRARPATPRLFSAFDIQPYDSLIQQTTFPQTIFDNLSKVPRISDYIDPNRPWSMLLALNALLAVSNTIIIDCPLYLAGQITGPLSGKRLIFLGAGERGAIRVIITTTTTSFMDLSGVHDLIIDGYCRVQYPLRAGAAVKCIKGTAFTNVRIASLYTSGIDYAINVDGAINGFEIGEVEIENSGTDTALTINANAAPTSLRTKIGHILGRSEYQTDPASGAAFTYVPWTMANVVNLNGTQTANRVVTGSLANASEGYRATFLHNAAGGFTYDIMGLKTISNGQSASVMIDNGAWVKAS